MNDSECAAGSSRKVRLGEFAMLQGIYNETVISDEVEALTN